MLTNGILSRDLPSRLIMLQELLIQQLQDELARVRRQLRSQHDVKRAGDMPSDVSDSSLIPGDIDQLKTQLHKAHRKIAQLTNDRQVLIDLGNRLRAQLIHHGQCVDK